MDDLNNTPAAGTDGPEIKPDASKVTLVTLGEQPNIELGIAEVLKLIDLGKEGKDLYEAVMDNGGIGLEDVVDIPAAGKFAIAIFGFVNNGSYKLLPAELVDVDLTEADEIVNAIVEKFKVTEDKAKSIITNAIKAAYYIKETVQSF